MERNAKLISAGIFAIVAYITLFYQLGGESLRLWDEGRLANNTVEMLNNGNFFVTYYNGEPDMWSTKPPFLIWIQGLSVTLFGLNEWALRFPSALAALFTSIILWRFCMVSLNNWWIGFVSAIFLISNPAYAGYHVARTADYDAMLILFTTVFILYIYRFVNTKNNLFLYVSLTALTLGVLTKGVAAILFVPFVGLWLLYSKEVLELLKNKHFYFSASILIVFGLGYYFLRESLNPGYIDAVRNNELGGRFNEVLEGNDGKWWYYIMAISKKGFYVTIPLMVWGFIKLRDKPRLANLLTLVTIGFLVLISSAQTKLNWYVAPLYPILALAAGVGIYSIIENSFKVKKYWGVVATSALSLVILWFAHISYIFNLPKDVRKKHPGTAFADYIAEIPQHKKYKMITSDGANPHAIFYAHLYNQKGYDIKQAGFNFVEPGDTLMLCEPEIKARIYSTYDYQLLDSGVRCTLVKVDAPK